MADLDGEAAGEQSWTNYPSRHGGSGGPVDRNRGIKHAANVAGTIASTTNTVTSHAAMLGMGAVGVLALNPVGALVAGGVATGVGMVQGARSAYSTNKILNQLHEIRRNHKRLTCSTIGFVPPSAACDHAAIADQVLGYIIAQKQEKLGKKIGATAGLGTAVSLYSMMRAGYKSLRGTRGKKRNFYAHVLSRHLVTHDCKLAESIAAALYSPTEAAALMRMDSDKAGGLLADKIKSV